MIKNFTDLAERLKGIKVGEEELTPEKFIELIKAEDEHEVTITEGRFLTPDSLEELKTNVGKDSYEDGKKVGSEKFAKELKLSFGLSGDEYPGKDVASLKNILSKIILKEAKLEPEKKVKELSESLETLQKRYETETETLKSEIQRRESLLKDKDINTMLLTDIPKELKGLKPNQAVSLFRMEYGIEHDEAGQPLVKHGGKILKDDMEKVKPYNEVFRDFLKSNGWLHVEGRGGNTETGGHSSEFKTMNDVMKHLEKNKIDVTSDEGLRIISKFKEREKAQV